MRIVFLIFSLIVVFALTVPLDAARRPRSKKKVAPPPIDVVRINDPSFVEMIGPEARGTAVLRAQVLLDRAHFSPGELDGAYQGATERAVTAYQKSRGLPVTGVVDAETWRALNADAAPILVSYALAREDVAGPFVPQIPADMVDKARLKALSYTSALEGIAEKFHASPKLLRQLNGGKGFRKPGEVITVPNVLAPVPGIAAAVVVDSSDRTVTALDAAGKVLAHYPATIGSHHDPLPVGQWKITKIWHNPVFHYNPDLFWDADPSHSKAKIAPGPNNPVGLVWMSLSKQHYGIHGTPEPSLIGRTQSHGCIRLTNWDATELAQMIAPGTSAILQE